MLSTLGLSLSMTVPSTSKGMNRVALVEFGSGCCHSDNSAKAAVRACNDAVEWNSIKVRTIIPGSYVRCASTSTSPPSRQLRPRSSRTKFLKARGKQENIVRLGPGFPMSPCVSANAFSSQSSSTNPETRHLLHDGPDHGQVATFWRTLETFACLALGLPTRPCTPAYSVFRPSRAFSHRAHKNFLSAMPARATVTSADASPSGAFYMYTRFTHRSDATLDRVFASLFN